MLQREIHTPKGERCARDSRLRLFGRRLLETFSHGSAKLSSIRKLISRLNDQPSRSTIEEIRELGSTFRSLSRRERALEVELAVFSCLSRVIICSADPALRGAAETECRMTDWKIKEGISKPF